MDRHWVAYLTGSRPRLLVWTQADKPKHAQARN